jgi:FkbM family methyltransferase
MIPGVSAYLAFDGRLTVVEVAATDRFWADRVLAESPETRLHRFPRHGAGMGSRDHLDGALSLDRALAALGVEHVNYLRIADADAAIPVLLGARRLLSHARVDIVEIAGSSTADHSIARINALLGPFDFLQLQLNAQLSNLLLAPSGSGAANVLLFALHGRFASAVGGSKREPDLGALMAAHRLTPRGIIHVGAHMGEEVASYLALGFQRVLLVEAHPTLAAALADRLRDEPRVAVASCAITDFDGMIDLRVASSVFSSSILSLKRHAEIFPEISETGQVRVRAMRLDSLLAERNYADDDFNLVTFDIQGAELLALRGAARLLPRLDGLVVEVNFIELYDGCAQIEDIDDHLFERGFARVMTMSPYRSCLGDAFYLKTSATP